MRFTFLGLTTPELPTERSAYQVAGTVPEEPFRHSVHGALGHQSIHLKSPQHRYKFQPTGIWGRGRKVMNVIRVFLFDRRLPPVPS